MECVVSGIAVTPSEFEAPGVYFGLLGSVRARLVPDLRASGLTLAFLRKVGHSRERRISPTTRTAEQPSYTIGDSKEELSPPQNQGRHFRRYLR